MDELYIYTVKVNVAIAVFYLLYRILFNRDTFFVIRRFFLSTVLFLSFIYPFISLSSWLEQREPLQVMVINYAELLQTLTEQTTIEPVVVEKTLFTLENVLLLGYLIGVFVMVVRMLLQLISVIRLRRKGMVLMWHGTKIISLQDEVAPFSFFGWIFINPKHHEAAETDEIIAHEKAHVNQYHSIDMLVGELLCIFFWFNPTVWLLRDEIRQNLEFLADKDVMISGYNRKSYQYHLLRLSHQSVATQIVNNFNVSQLKRRITMMNKKKTSRLGLIKYALLLPVTGLLILSGNAQAVVHFAKTAIENNKLVIPEIKEVAEEFVPFVRSQQNVVDQNVLDEGKLVVKGIVTDEQGRPLPGATVVIKGKSIGTCVDKEGRYHLEADKDAVLSFSYVGKKTQTIQVKDVKNELNVQMKTNVLQLDRVVVTGMPANKDKTAQQEEFVIFRVVEDMPKFKDGNVLEYIARNVKYPTLALEHGIEGIVVVQFVIDKQGKVTSPTVVKSVDKSLDKEAIRVITSMPDWIPGKQRGMPVNVQYVLPIEFRLDKGSVNGKEDERQIHYNLGVERDNEVKQTESFTSMQKKNTLDGIGVKSIETMRDSLKAMLVIDGEIMPSNFDMEKIDVTSVISIEILKDKSAIAVWGEKGKNGVIIITTKK